jgi:hypothetical protein
VVQGCEGPVCLVGAIQSEASPGLSPVVVGFLVKLVTEESVSTRSHDAIGSRRAPKKSASAKNAFLVLETGGPLPPTSPRCIPDSGGV